MAKFKYSMQSILNIKLQMENLAKQQFSAAKFALDEEEEKLNTLFCRKEEYQEKAKTLLCGSLNVRDIEDNKNALLMMDQYIAEQQKAVRKAEERLEFAKQELTEAMKERKMQETLREKAFEAFMQEENRQEGKTVDELTSYTYGQKQQVKE